MGRNPFSKSTNRDAPEPVRKNQVMRLLKLHMQMEQALDREQHNDDDATPAFDRAKKALHAAEKASTTAEIRAAAAAAHRHGF